MIFFLVIYTLICVCNGIIKCAHAHDKHFKESIAVTAMQQ